MKWTGLFILPLLLLIGGCISTNYVGQDFPPIPEGRSVLFFDERNPVPAGMYQAIGRAEVEFPHGYNSIDMREKLSSVAREHGGAAIRIVSEEKKLINTYYDAGSGGGDSMLSSRSSTGALVLQPNGSRTAIDSFGNPVQGTRTYTKEYRTLIKILVMMPVQDYQRAMKERQKAAEWVPAPEAPAQKAPEKKAPEAPAQAAEKK